MSNLRDTIIKNIMDKFSEEYNIVEKEVPHHTHTELNITKYTMCNININIQIHAYSSSLCNVYIVDRDGIKRICTAENYLEEIDKFLDNIRKNIDSYLEFIHNILDYLDNNENNDTEYSVYDDYLINSDGEFYLKKSGKTIKIYPIYSFDTYKAMENHEPLCVVPVCGFNQDVKLMKIFPKSANISDTSDALLFFLE